MMTSMRRIIKYCIAIFLIWVGIMLIVNSLNIDGFEMNFGWGYIYPLFFIVAGSVLLVTSLFKKRGGWMFGTFLLIFGGLLLAGRFGFVDFTFWSVFKLWPLLLVFIGFSLFRGAKFFFSYSSGEKKSKKRFSSTKTKGNKEFLIGDYEKKGNWNLEPMNINTLAGNFYLDLTSAYIPDEETEIKIQAMAGDVTILIPEQIEFYAHAKAKAGDIIILDKESAGVGTELVYETDQFETAKKRLMIDIRLKAGAIRIDQV